MAITKLYQIVSKIEGVRDTFNVKGFQSAKIDLYVGGLDDEVNVKVYGSKDFSTPVEVAKNLIPQYFNKRLVSSDTIYGNGVHSISLDVYGYSKILIVVDKNEGFQGDVTLTTSYDKFQLYQDTTEKVIGESVSSIGEYTYNVSNDKMVRVVLNVTEMTSITLKGEVDINKRFQPSSPNVDYYINSIKYRGLTSLPIGTHSIWVDVEYVNSLFFSINSGKCTADIISSKDSIPSIYRTPIYSDVNHDLNGISIDKKGGYRFHVANRKSAKINIYTDDEILISLYGSVDPFAKLDNNSKKLNFYKDRELLTGNVVLPAHNVYELWVDLYDVNYMLFDIGSVVSEPNVQVDIVTYEDDIPINKTFKSIPIKKDNYFKGFVQGKHKEIIDLSPNAKQLDVIVKNTTFNPSDYYRIKGTKDGVTWVLMNFMDTTTKSFAANGFTSANDGVSKIYANVEGYLRIEVEMGLPKNRSVNLEIKVSDDYIDREVPLYDNISRFNRYGLSRGYKYISIDLTGTKVSDTSARLSVYAYNEAGDVLEFDRWTKDGERNNNHWNPSLNKGIAVQNLYGDIGAGQVHIHSDDAFSGGIIVGLTAVDTLSGGSVELNGKLILSNTRPKNIEAELVKDGNDYRIYQYPTTNYYYDVTHRDILEWEYNKLRMWVNGFDGLRVDIPFNNTSVPSLLSGEIIKAAYLLPFNKNKRGDNVGTFRANTRIVVFTSKGRILHNFPDRISGVKPDSDMGKFEESAVYNPFKKWLPTNDKSKAGGLYKYFPVLKEYDYDQFEGRLVGTDGYVNHFNTNGLQMSDAPLMDCVKGREQIYRTLAYSSIVKDTKMTLFGNYSVQEGEEPFAMGTSNGGKSWYVKAWFANTDMELNMRGGKVDFTPITAISGAYAPNSLKMSRKRFNYPTDLDKEPENPFRILEIETSLVESITVEDGTVVILTSEDMEYNSNNPIVFFENVSANSEWDYICNNGFDETGVTNNGVFFRAKKIGSKKYALYGDVGNPYESEAMCRHVHTVTRSQGGYMVATGENYPQGNIYYIEQPFRNGDSPIDASMEMPLKRLTSSKDAPLRTCGAYLFNDSSDPTVLLASDSYLLGNAPKEVSLTGRTISLQMPPLGIYKGKLSDIDDFSKFECIMDSKSTILSLVEHMGNFASEGHSDSLMVSKGGFKWQMVQNMSFNQQIVGADYRGNIYIGNLGYIEFK